MKSGDNSLMQIVGKRLFVASESRAALFSPAKIKSLTGTDVISARTIDYSSIPEGKDVVTVGGR